MSTETTIQADVAPGDQTGVYHITICNLPFGASWQALKDWIRSACKVERIEIFQNSTSGWVRVRGKENFEKAWALLNGGVFDGRSIIASDRNRTDFIKIKEMVGRPAQFYQPYHPQVIRYNPAAPSFVAHSPVTVPQQYAAASCSQHYPGLYSTASVPSGPGYVSPPVTVAVHNYQQPSGPPTTVSSPASSAFPTLEAAGSYYTYADVGAAVASTGDQGQPLLTTSWPREDSHYPQAPHGYPSAKTELSERGSSSYNGVSSVAQAEPAPGFVPTELRKVHASPFPQQAGAEEVRKWLRRKLITCDWESIEVPTNSNSKYLRGHALIILGSTGEARRAVALLSKARFQGKRLTAKFTTEGVTAGEQQQVAAAQQASHELVDPSPNPEAVPAPVQTPARPSSTGNGYYYGGESSQGQHRAYGAIGSCNGGGGSSKSSGSRSRVGESSRDPRQFTQGRGGTYYGGESSRSSRPDKKRSSADRRPLAPSSSSKKSFHSDKTTAQPKGKPPYSSAEKPPHHSGSHGSSGSKTSTASGSGSASASGSSNGSGRGSGSDKGNESGPVLVVDGSSGGKREKRERREVLADVE